MISLGIGLANGPRPRILIGASSLPELRQQLPAVSPRVALNACRIVGCPQCPLVVKAIDDRSSGPVPESCAASIYPASKAKRFLGLGTRSAPGFGVVWSQY